MRRTALPPHPRSIWIVVDTPCWFDPFADRLVERLHKLGPRVVLTRNAEDIGHGGLAFFLSCTRIVKPAVLARSTLNIVVHASALPSGRGFSPIVWQILDGAAVIPITMIEAAEVVDSGDIIMHSELVLEGHELNDEIRSRLGEKIVEMCVDVASRDSVELVPQTGDASWYPRRSTADSQLEPNQSLAEQFELLRVVDNDRYPAFFDYRGHRYVLRIAKQTAL